MRRRKETEQFAEQRANKNQTSKYICKSFFKINICLNIFSRLFYRIRSMNGVFFPFLETLWMIFEIKQQLPDS